MNDDKKIRGMIFDIQRYSIHDGGGIRTVVFLNGCALRCGWCSNPESQSGVPELMYSVQKCRGCGKCIALCPQKAIGRDASSGVLTFDRSRCSGCHTCVDVCTSNAWRVAGRLVTSGELIDAVLRDQVIYHTSGGGITISGGKPFHQLEFLLDLLQTCENNALHTAIRHGNGSSGQRKKGRNATCQRRDFRLQWKRPDRPDRSNALRR